ncbi:MAG: cation:proton antiporter [Anaerolineae bacterium]|nr:cation:proton antiporter [Anaerolineae bacterium]
MVVPLEEPVAVFLTIMSVILITPLLSERIRLPGIVGLILGGMLVGPHGLGLLGTGRVIELLSTVGLVYLMFSAGLEVDLHQFNRVRNKAMFFGLLTFMIPQLFGTFMGRLLFGLDWPSAILLGSVYASHTLVAFPILGRLGLVTNEAVSVTIGATIFTDVASLLVLAVVAGAQNGDVSVMSIAWLVGLMAGYAALILLAMPRVGKSFFRHFSGRAVEFQFVLVVLFVAALLAEQIGMHAIVGAFLAGLAINSTLPPRSAVIGQVLFLGESFFIPIFLMYIGMITDPLVVVVDVQTLLTGLALTATVYATKFAAAWITARVFRYSRNELFTVWGLSQAQAAATLATILVGVNIGLFSMAIFNGAILMILCTCITSPLLVQRFGSRLTASGKPAEKKVLFDRILVPVANPQTEEHLITLANILARSTKGILLPLHVAQAINHQPGEMEHQQQLLDRVPEILADPETQIHAVRRIDTSIAKGILHAAIEHEASLIVMGWRGKPTFRQSIYGTLLDEVVWNTTVPVLVGRLVTPINAVRRILLVIPPNRLYIGLFGTMLEMVGAISQAINVPLIILTTSRYEAKMAEALNKSAYKCPVLHLEKDVVSSVAQKAGPHDLIVVTATGSQQRFRSSLGPIPERLVAATSSSVGIVHYP